jgi:hypothetical protein
LLLGADEVQITPTRGPTPSTGSGSRVRRGGTNYDDVIAIAGALNAILISNLGSADLSTLNGRPELSGHPTYRALFTSAERRWYRDTWGQQKNTLRGEPANSVSAAGQILFRALANGARVATGSRAPLTPYGLGLQAELQLLAATGLPPFQVLKMAGLDAARVLGAGEDLGSLHPGKLADLVIIDGDPLRNIADTANVVTTIVNGRPYSVEELLVPGGRAGGVGKFYTSGGGN